MVVQNTSYLIPHKSQNYNHDFRIAIFSFLKPYSQISDFNFNSADIILYPSAVTNVSWSLSVGPGTPGGGSFGLIAGLRGQQSISNKSSVFYDTDGSIIVEIQDENKLVNKLGGFFRNQDDVQNKTLGDFFSNLNTVISPMDYVAIFAKDKTGGWYDQADDISQARPIFIGVITDITASDNAAANRMTYDVQFKTLLRLLDLGRYATSKSIVPILQAITGLPFGESAENIFLGAKNVFSNAKPNEILKNVVKPWYPSESVGPRIELDKSRAEAQSLSWENFVYSSLMGNFNYDSVLNKLRQFANNKDFEFYADEDGQLVWKLPTYARGINRQIGNFIEQNYFDPDNYERNDSQAYYHLHELISSSFRLSESELINVVSGPNDATVQFLDSSQTNALLEPYRRAFYIKGGPDAKDYTDRQYGFLDIGVRPIAIQNPVHYNATYLAAKTSAPVINIYGYDTQTTLTEAQLMYYMFKTYKLNISRYYTGNATLVDDPRIKVGMPCVIPKYARAGSDNLKGRIIPSIYYISAVSRRYEAGKLPILSLTLTHGRFITDEFHNGIHLFGSLSSWMARTEGETDETTGGLFTEVYQQPLNQLLSVGNFAPVPPTAKDVLNFPKNDKRIQDLVEEQDFYLSTELRSVRTDLLPRIEPE